MYKPEDADVVFVYDYCYLARCGHCSIQLEVPEQCWEIDTDWIMREPCCITMCPLQHPCW